MRAPSWFGLSMAVGCSLSCGPLATGPSERGPLELALPPNTCDPPHYACNLHPLTAAERNQYAATLVYVLNNEQCSIIYNAILERAEYEQPLYVWDDPVYNPDGSGPVNGDYHGWPDAFNTWHGEIHHYSERFGMMSWYFAGDVIHEAAHSLGYLEEAEADIAVRDCRSPLL